MSARGGVAGRGWAINRWGRSSKRTTGRAGSPGRADGSGTSSTAHTNAPSAPGGMQRRRFWWGANSFYWASGGPARSGRRAPASTRPACRAAGAASSGGARRAIGTCVKGRNPTYGGPRKPGVTVGGIGAAWTGISMGTPSTRSVPWIAMRRGRTGQPVDGLETPTIESRPSHVWSPAPSRDCRPSATAQWWTGQVRPATGNRHVTAPGRLSSGRAAGGAVWIGGGKARDRPER